MGPSIDINQTAEKEKTFLALIENVFPRVRSYHRGIDLLKDGRIICYDYSIKIYKYKDKTFILDYEFKIEPNEEIPTSSMYEVENNIIIFGSYMKLYLLDIRNNQAKLLQKISFDFHNYILQCFKLDNGLIVAHNTINIIFYKYDEENKKLDKVDEIKFEISINKIFEIKNGNIITSVNNELIIYGQNKNIQTRIKINKRIYSCNILDWEYILISYQDKDYPPANCFVDVYSIKNFKLLQTLEVKYRLNDFIKLNDNLLVASDVNGNIQELQIDENHRLSSKDIFRAHECPISRLCKFDDNKLLSISHDGSVKLWEFN